MVDKKFDEKEANELKKICNHYFDKRKEFMKNTEFKVESVFGDVINQDIFGQKQISKLNDFSQNNVNISFSKKINLFEPRKEK